MPGAYRIFDGMDVHRLAQASLLPTIAPCAPTIALCAQVPDVGWHLMNFGRDKLSKNNSRYAGFSRLHTNLHACTWKT